MLFNSYEFIFIFLPLTLFLFFTLNRLIGFQAGTFWLICASLIFYAWWNPLLLGLMVGSIAINILFGRYLVGGGGSAGRRKLVLVAGIFFNLGLLGYFKYAGFIAENFNALFEGGLQFGEIVLPIAISFYTFQQIAFLVDAHRNLLDVSFSIPQYFLFVTFFPQLIAGPIVHHGEMIPQYSKLKGKRFSFENLSIGVSIFSIGLFKKVVLADTSAHWADPLFTAAANGTVLSFAESWIAALAFTFQIYFDFSSYSDMAIGIARMFGIILPLNFLSPYKATSIIEFWRRWHMTLSRFLRDYLYYPLGGNKHGKARRYLNLGIVMLLGGLWHGAAWTFVAWGALHGFYLVVNHAWRAFAHRSQVTTNAELSRTITFVAVIFSWVLFRAQDFPSAVSIFKSMVGMNGLSLGKSLGLKAGTFAPALANYGVVFNGLFSNGIMPDRDFALAWMILLIIFVIKAPATHDIFPNCALEPDGDSPVETSRISRFVWHRQMAWGIGTGLMIFLSLQQFSKVTPFLYFQF
jgi:D-alanyl-lipoteichoic acid acyltransferase DltB (MBOAT superfamily)